MNMVSETLECDGDRTTILRFNPWLFNGANDLVTLFFRELSAQLGQNKFWELKKVARVLAGLGQILAPLSPVPGTTEIAHLVRSQAEDWANQPSLRYKREQLEEALKNSESRVVVLIDDIDRLEPHETRDLMRLVRLMSELPHVVLLLAFDRQRVAKSLDQEEVEGAKYLDKIVQLSYEVPVLRKSALANALLTSLVNIVRNYDLVSLDGEVWQRVHNDIVMPLLGTLRDVKRYVNALPATFEIVGQEVAQADLLGLEAVRVLRPRLFDALKAQATNLVDSDSPSLLGKPQEIRDRETQEALQGMLEQAADDRGFLQLLLQILFPATQRRHSSGSYSETLLGTWRAQRRVACEEVLNIYLHGGLEEGALAWREIMELVEALTDEEKLVRILDDLDEQGLERALERLEDFEQEFPIEAASIAVPVLANRMGKLSDHASGMLFFSPRVKASRVILRLLRRIQNPKVLTDIMSSVLVKVDTLSGWQCLVELVGHRENIGHKLVSEEDAKGFEAQLVERLKSATTEQLMAEWDLCALTLRTVYRLEGKDKDELAERLRHHLRQEGFIFTLLRTAVRYVRYNGNADKRLPWDDILVTFGDELKNAVDRLARSQSSKDLSEYDRATISLAQKYALGWRPPAWPGGSC